MTRTEDNRMERRFKVKSFSQNNWKRVNRDDDGTKNCQKSTAAEDCIE